jgi:3-oxoacyl-[acyl-carrier-protein] synthase III
MPPPLVSLSQAPLTKTDAQLVAEACGRAAKALGLSRDELSTVVGASTAPAQPARAWIPEPRKGCWRWPGP